MTESIINAFLPFFQPGTFQGSEAPLSYRLHCPAAPKQGRQYPLALIMHGAGSIGDNNMAQLFLTGLFCKNPAVDMDNMFVLAPQCPKGHLWIDNQGTWDGRFFFFKPHPAPHMKTLMELISALPSQYPVDKRKLWVGGASMGGYATWDIITRMPGFFEKAFPICGAGDPAKADIVAQTKTWAFHGGCDATVNPDASRRMVRRMLDIKADIHYTEFPSAPHNSWEPAFKHTPFFNWLLDNNQ